MSMWEKVSSLLASQRGKLQELKGGFQVQLAAQYVLQIIIYLKHPKLLSWQ